VTTALVPLQTHAASLSELLEDTTAIETAEDFQVFADTLREIKTKRKIIEEEKDKVTRPMREALAAARELFDKIDDQYKTAESTIKRLIADYSVREQEAERKKLAAALDSGNARALVDLASQAAPVAQGVSTRDKFEFVIKDPSLVPDEYKCIDEKKIGAVVRASKGTIVIPGVEVVISTTVSARGK
jgi:hypothetical protein